MFVRPKVLCTLALAVSVLCVGAGSALAEETALASENGMVRPATGDNNALYRSLTPERQAIYNDIIKATEEAMLPLREQMMAKRLQLETMASMPNMDHEAIAKVAAEIAALHTQMIKVHDGMADRFAKELGLSIRRGTCSDGYSSCPMHRGTCGQWLGGPHHRNMMGLMPIMPTS